MNSWSMKGNPDAIWEVIGNREVSQVEWGFPASFFVGNLDLINVRIKGIMSVYEAEDNDFMGIVFGYKSPTTTSEDANYNMYLFDWKSEEENIAGLYANEGFRLSSYNGFISIDNQREYFYMDIDAAPLRDVIDRSYGQDKGWLHNREYEIELIYTQGEIAIYIDTELIFEQSVCSEPGKFGFYTMSQPYVYFKDFYFEDYTIMYQSYDSVCLGNTISFYPYNPKCGGKPAFITNVEWDFGDGSTSNEINADHTYTEAGIYNITLIVNGGSDCADTISSSAKVLEIPEADLGEDLNVLVCSTFELDAQNPGYDYLWSTGESTQKIEIDNIANDTSFWVRVIKNGCIDSDTINIDVENPQADIYMPSAFTPNGDGTHDEFKPVNINSLINTFKISIYNRWGQLMFESDDPNYGWNGYYSGEICPKGTYTYLVSYGTESCLGSNQNNLTGIVTLIR